ncbi:MAG: LysM peptidoglycan-binding domain-containing protein [Steroidobacteraceae bacterium]
MSKYKTLIPLCFGLAFSAGCQSSWNPFHKKDQSSAPVPVAGAETDVQGTVVGDERTAMEAAADGGARVSTQSAEAPAAGPVLAPGAPESYVVKRGDTLWGISKMFLRDPWYWPEIWHANPQIQNPHLIYPGDTLRLVYIDGQPHVTLERGDAARVQPRVRSQPLEDAIRAIPYEIIAAFMSKPSVITKEDIKKAPYVLASRDRHVVMAEGNTVYARGFDAPAEVGSHYNIVRVGEKLRDPDGGDVIGYDGIFTAAGKVTRGGDPTTLLLTESGRETLAGDKLFSGSVDVPLDFVPSAPKIKVDGQIISVHDGVEMIGQYQVVVINRGARHGLVPGNVLGIYRLGEVVPDREKNRLVHNLTVFAKNVRLPEERTGTFMVFKTFDRISYGLVMEAKNTIKVLDKIKNP